MSNIYSVHSISELDKIRENWESIRDEFYEIYDEDQDYIPAELMFYRTQDKQNGFRVAVWGYEEKILIPIAIPECDFVMIIDPDDEEEDSDAYELKFSDLKEIMKPYITEKDNPIKHYLIDAIPLDDELKKLFKQHSHA
jgi:hypothetical protein